jgi:ribosomal protein S18 acetylase RimI-like enzyme
LYVKEAYRGQGIGTAFFRYIEGLGGIAAMQLETTPSNRRTVDFYRRLGFAPSENTHWIKPV